jgi:WD40 repeat protein
MIVFRTLACILVGIFLIPSFPDAKQAVREDQQSPFRVYTIDSGWGYYGAAFSPDNSLVALIGSKGTLGKQGTEVIEEIQIWDFRNKNLVAEKVLSRQLLPTPDASYERETFLYAYTQSGSMIMLYRSGHLALLDSHTFEEVRNVDLGIAQWPKSPPNSSSHPFVKKVALDSSAARVAVLLQWGSGGGGELRVYSLAPGDLIRKWDYHDLKADSGRYADFGGMDISPDGKRVAVSVIPFVLGEGVLRPSDRNVFILDIDSGSKISEINTRYPAGDVCFAPTDPLTLLTVSADNFDKERSSKDAIEIWDPQTGKMLRELTAPAEGVHFQVQVSSDGHTLMGYTGLEKFADHWWLGQEETGRIAYDRFRLWDLATGHVIAASPEIPPSASRREFRLSPKGDVVLLYPDTPGERTVTFYELVSAP